jgi:Fe-S-cluster containining protein
MRRIFRLYEQHAADWDAEFRRLRERFAGRIQCGRGCSACCSQMFSISALEAAAIARGVAAMPEGERTRLREAARAYLAEAERLGVVRQAAGEESVTPRTGVRLPCPALRNDACTIYEVRPLICRKWGIPVFDPSKPDRLHGCELNFRSGEGIEAAAVVAEQTELLERWVALKDDARQEMAMPARTYTVAEALLS